MAVRNNQLSSQMATFSITGDLGLWNESGFCDDLLIENNVIDNSVFGGNGAQAIFFIEPQYPEKKNKEGKYSKNITIRNNIIKTFDSSILVAASIDGLIFENNQIIQTDTYKPIFPDAINVSIENCNDVTIKGNTYKKIDGKEVTISIDEKSTNVKIEKGDIFSNNLKS